MKINKTTTCEILVGINDYISNIIVIGSEGFHEDQLGIQVNDRGEPHYVCTKLIVNGGRVGGVTVKENGVVIAESGEIDCVELCQNGKMYINKAKVTNIVEAGGAFFASGDAKGTWSCSGNISVFIVDGHCTVHKGSILGHTNFLSGAHVVVYTDGLLREASITSHAALIVRGGTVANSKSLGHIEIVDGLLKDVIVDDGDFVILESGEPCFKNVKISNKVKIRRTASSTSKIKLNDSLKGLDIEDGTEIVNEISDPVNGISEETIYYNKENNHA